jgi:hypothetical protein
MGRTVQKVAKDYHQVPMSEVRTVTDATEGEQPNKGVCVKCQEIFGVSLC